VTHRERQFGFSLVSAVFLLVVLAALGVFMLRFSNVQHMSSARDVEAAKVYRLALAGADYGAFQVLQGGGVCPVSVTLPFPGGYATTVNCAAAGPYAEPGGAVSVYSVTATACNRPASGACPGTPDGLTYVERQVHLMLSR
jgi:MSHA biogenesis protein MshP